MARASARAGAARAARGGECCCSCRLLRLPFWCGGDLSRWNLGAGRRPAPHPDTHPRMEVPLASVAPTRPFRGAWLVATALSLAVALFAAAAFAEPLAVIASVKGKVEGTPARGGAAQA